ncbi:hypothetical protein HYS91_01910 [Candidatus Daviesbacteria bacterium]|nr:hypothetical protein [Candidatus Daviesbacteria bacterium]
MSTKQIENHLSANANMRKKDILIGNFLGGLAWGFGTVIGATIVAALLIAILRSVNVLPVIGVITNTVLETVEQRQNKD